MDEWEEFMDENATYCTFLDLLESPLREIIVEGDSWVKYRYLNYGHFTQHINEADNLGWDIFVVDLDHQLEDDSIHEVTEIVGAFILPNGNHKIAVCVGPTGQTEENGGLIVSNIEAFRLAYTKETDLPMIWLD
jgi:hypothetical protein